MSKWPKKKPFERRHKLNVIWVILMLMMMIMMTIEGYDLEMVAAFGWFHLLLWCTFREVTIAYPISRTLCKYYQLNRCQATVRMIFFSTPKIHQNIYIHHDFSTYFNYSLCLLLGLCLMLPAIVKALAKCPNIFKVSSLWFWLLANTWINQAGCAGQTWIDMSRKGAKVIHIDRYM